MGFKLPSDSSKMQKISDTKLKAIVFIPLVVVCLLLTLAFANEAYGHHTGEKATVEVQVALNKYGYSLRVDGIYGPNTTKAVRHWQKANGLTPDGIAGPITRSSLGLGVPNNGGSAQTNNANQQELEPVGTGPGFIDQNGDGLPDGGINQPASTDGLQPAVRLGLQGKPFAPVGLDNCDEMQFYREQWGLPAVFDSIGYRESRCRNEDSIRTFCCHGYWQMWAELHMRDHRLAPKYAACEVTSFHDINSNSGIEKQKQACVARGLYEVDGLRPWAL